jgi:predicted transcriptional regulator
MGWDIERIPVSTDTALKELSMKLSNAEDVLEQREKLIQKLQSEKEELQEKCGQLLEKQYNDDYKFQNSKNVIENLHKTLHRYETENKALRELLRLWM